MKEISKRILGHLDRLERGILKEIASAREERQATGKRVEKLIAELGTLREEHADVERTKLALRGHEALQNAFEQVLGPAVIEAAKKIVRTEVAKLGGIDPVQLKQMMVSTTKLDEGTMRSIAKEEAAKISISRSAEGAGVSMDEIKKEIQRQVGAAVQGSANVTMLEPKEYLVKAVLKREVESVKTEVEKFPSQTRLMLGSLASVAPKSVEFTDLMIRFVGSDGGGQRKQYLYPLRGIPSVVNYDSSHGQARYVWRERMKEAYPALTEADLDAAMAQVHALLATNVT